MLLNPNTCQLELYSVTNDIFMHTPDTERVSIMHGLSFVSFVESRGRVVTRWPGSQEVGGSIPAATKIVKCKNLAFNIGECVSRGSDTT